MTANPVFPVSFDYCTVIYKLVRFYIFYDIMDCDLSRRLAYYVFQMRKVTTLANRRK